jgi:hypothetical protein
MILGWWELVVNLPVTLTVAVCQIMLTIVGKVDATAGQRLGPVDPLDQDPHQSLPEFLALFVADRGPEILTGLCP